MFLCKRRGLGCVGVRSSLAVRGVRPRDSASAMCSRVGTEAGCPSAILGVSLLTGVSVTPVAQRHLWVSHGLIDPHTCTLPPPVPSISRGSIASQTYLFLSCLCRVSNPPTDLYSPHSQGLVGVGVCRGCGTEGVGSLSWA